MQAIETLYEYVKGTYPTATAILTRPLNSGGFWSLDVDSDDKSVAIQWSSKTGFGISSVNPETFGEKPDEAFESLEEARGRVDQLLSSNERTSPPRSVLLSRLRERRGLTQKQLAEKLGVRQATISGFERRGDIQLSTLRRLVEALGGFLGVWACFADGNYRIDTFSAGEDRNAPPPQSIVEQDLDDSFDTLRQAGTLAQAFAAANAIRSNHAVIEMP